MMKNSFRLKFLMFFLFTVVLQLKLNAQEALRTDGKIIVSTSNHKVLLKGVNLGQWLLMEGFMSGSYGDMAQVDMKRKLYDNDFTRQEIESLFAKYRKGFITKADIDYIASIGFNCVRLPLHYELFLTASQREERLDVIYSNGSKKAQEYGDYKEKLGNWAETNQLAVSDSIEGFQIIDQLIYWCRSNNLYIILDMHAIPGTIGTTRNITDQLLTPLDFFKDENNQKALYNIWDKISERYKDDNTIAMYDLINEPHQKIDGSAVSYSSSQMHQLRNAYNQMINKIRTNGDRTLILLQGDSYGNDYYQSGVSLYPSDFDNPANLVYNFHRYRASNSLSDKGAKGNINSFGNAIEFRDDHNVPLFVGETGLDPNYSRLKGNYEALDSLGIGWTLWSFKHHTDDQTNRCPFDIPESNPWDDLSSWKDGSLFKNILFKNCTVNPESKYWEAITSTLKDVEQEKSSSD